MEKQNKIKLPNTRKKTPSVLQMEMVECGAASLAMVCAYYKKYIPLEKLRVECGVTRDGTNAGNIVRAAGKLGFVARGFRKEPHDLASIRIPCIIHWNFNHFVVFEGFKRGKAYINDPAEGHRVLSYDEFDLAFTGIVLTFEPTEGFVADGTPPSIMTSLKKRLESSYSALAFLITVGLLMVIPGIIQPTFSRIFIDDLLLQGKDSWFMPLIALMALTCVATALFTWLQQRILLRMQLKIAIVGAGKFFWHILRLPVVFFQQRSAGDISNRMGSNDDVASFLAGELAEKIISVITLIFYFIVMITYNLPLALMSLGLGLVNVLYFMYASGKMEELNRKQSGDVNKLYGTAISGISLIETLKATGGEQGFFSKWAGYHAKQLNSQQLMGSISQVLMSLPSFITGLANVMVLCVGGLEIMNGRMTVGSLIGFQGLLGSFMAPISSITGLGLRIKQLKADMNRLDDVAKYEIDEYNDPERDLPADENPLDSYGKLTGEVEIRNLSFGYNLLEGPLIEDFNLKLKPGARVALVGGSGSGKSTVAKLIAGINRPWSGEILFDGKRRELLPRHLISNSLAVVDQDISMFSGTIEENITMWDKTIASERVLTAAKDACIHSDINIRKLGYGDEVTESGSNFSGGQRQRMEIARALAVEPSILILDEATSALDTLTEQTVMDNIRARGSTCIIVAHRLSTIRDCDEIIVMKRGKIVQRGTHDQMVNESGLYAELIKTAV